MVYPAKRMENFSEYIHTTLGKKVQEIEQTSGKKVLNFGPGNPDIAPSRIYQDKLSEFIKDPDAHRYPSTGATPTFAQAVIKWYKNRFQVQLTPDELLPLLGAKDGISHFPLAFLNEQDQVLVPNPGYPAFTDPARMVGAIPVFYSLEQTHNFSIDYIALEKLITPKTKFIWVNFPSNPTGQVVTVQDLTKLIAFARKHKIFIVYDNAYSEITFDNYIAPSILEVEDAKDIAVEIGSFSKTFSFAGFRMGWIVGNKHIIATLAKLKSQMDSGLSLPLQNLGAYALTNPDKAWHDRMIASYKNRRDSIAEHITTLDVTFSLPKGGLYIWAKIPENEKDSETFCMKLLEKKHILFTPGTAFGSNGKRFVRISICVNIEHIDEYFTV